MKARLRMMQRLLRIKARLPQRKRTSFSLEEEEEREQQATHAGVTAPAQAKGKTPRSRRRQRSIREAKAAADAAEVATWASLLEEEMEAGPEREPEEEYEGWGYYLKVMDDNSDYDL